MPHGITIDKYKQTTKQILKLSFPQMAESDFDEAINYSIQKRYKEQPAQIVNNYKNTALDSTLLEIADYIYSR